MANTEGSLNFLITFYLWGWYTPADEYVWILKKNSQKLIVTLYPGNQAAVARLATQSP